MKSHERLKANSVVRKIKTKSHTRYNFRTDRENIAIPKGRDREMKRGL
jgi:hypothetical protein